MGGIGEIRVIGGIRVIENYIIGYCHIYLNSFGFGRNWGSGNEGRS